jgi:hypothetical protein
VVLLVSSAPPGTRRPFGDIQVAESASPLLHVGLEKIEATSEAPVATCRILLQRVEELDKVWLEHLLASPTLQVVEERAVSCEAAEVDQGRGSTDILPG